MTFDLLSVRFVFMAREPVQFPLEHAGNVLRGAFGGALRSIACVPDCPGHSGRNVRECAVRASCAYARIFEPAAIAPGPSGLADAPRPFVIRARHLNGRALQPDEAFCFDVNLFDARNPPVGEFRRTLAAMAANGFGEGRGAAELVSVQEAPVSIPLEPPAASVSRICVEFQAPTELKSAGGIAAQPEFSALFARARDRVSSLLAFYGPGPLELDFRGLGERSRLVQITRCDLHTVEATRRSSRTGQRHSIGGFVGAVEYEGNLGEFVPFLDAAQWTGVGRHCSWGNGQICLETLS